jgi:hypothetical protein
LAQLKLKDVVCRRDIVLWALTYPYGKFKPDYGIAVFIDM